MQFLQPKAAWLFAFVLVPLLIHLIAMRKRKHILFSNTALLHIIKKETQKNRRLFNMFLLILRIIIIGSICFAMLKPIFPISKENTSKESAKILFFIDNSRSMQLEGSSGSLFEEAKNKALDIVKSMPNHFEYLILSHDFNSLSNWSNKKEIVNQINDLNISAKSKSINEIFAKQKQLFSGLPNDVKTCYFLSDFAFYHDVELGLDTSINYFFTTLKSNNITNLSIDSIWFSEPIFEIGVENNLSIKISSRGKKTPINNSMTIFLDDQKIFTQIFEFTDSNEKIITLPIQTKNFGWHKIKAQIEDFPILFDDIFYAQFFVPQKDKILCIGEGGFEKHLQQVFQSSHNIQFKAPSELLKVNLEKYALIIANELKTLSLKEEDKLSIYLKNGGKVLFIPHMAGNKQFVKEISNQTLFENSRPLIKKIEGKKLNFSSPFFERMFLREPNNIHLPEIYLRRKIAAPFELEPLIVLANGECLLARKNFGQGWLYLLSSSLDPSSSNFHKLELFAPIMSRIAENSKTYLKNYYTVGQNNIIPIFNPKIDISEGIEAKFVNQSYHLSPSYSISGLSSLYDYKTINQAGHGALFKNDTSFQIISYNHSRRESVIRKNNQLINEISAQKNAQFIKNEKANQKYLQANILGRKILWKWFVLVAVLFLIFESLTLRLGG